MQHLGLNVLSGNVIAALLAGTAFYFAIKRNYRRAAITALFGFIVFVIVQCIAADFVSVENPVNIEKVSCWLFGAAFLLISASFLKQKSLSYAFLTFVLACCTFFCSLTGVQQLLKTQLLWQVTKSLNSYGEKLGTYADTVSQMREDLDSEQVTNKLERAEIATLQHQLTNTINSLSVVEQEIQHAETDIFRQQSEITNQYQVLNTNSLALAAAQQKIMEHQASLTNIQSLVTTLFGQTEMETINNDDTNRIVVFAFPGVTRILVKLQYVPVQNSIYAMAANNSNHSQYPIFPDFLQIGNILVINFSAEGIKSTILSFRYVKNPDQSSVGHNISYGSDTNTFVVDGIPYYFGLNGTVWRRN